MDMNEEGMAALENEIESLQERLIKAERECEIKGNEIRRLHAVIAEMREQMAAGNTGCVSDDAGETA